MEKKEETRHFSLEMRDTNRLTKVIQIIFGILCIAVAIYWLIFNFRSVNADKTIWITVVFLTGFGGYLVWSGLGYAYKFVEFGTDFVRLKKNSFLPQEEVNLEFIEKIEMYPLKVVIKKKSSGTILLRFGVTDVERIELIKDEFTRFAGDNNIEFEIRNEM